MRRALSVRRSFRRSGPAPGLAVLAAQVCLAALAFPGAAEAQSTVWEADLDARRFSIPGSGIGANHGCYNGGANIISCANMSRLTDDDFTVDGVSYSVTRLAVDQNGELTIAFDPEPPDAFDNLVLVLGTDKFPLEDADNSVAEARSWSSSGLSWTLGTDVAVALELPEPVAACDGDEAPAGAFWTTCLTVGQDAQALFFGYGQGIYGSLDDRTFHRDGTTHHILALTTNLTDNLLLRFFAAPASTSSGWTLQVGSDSLALSAATFASNGYSWRGGTNQFTSSDVGEKITVSLRAPEPGAPTGLTAAGSSATQIDLSWTAPAYVGNSAITGYKIEVSTDGSTWTDLVANTASTTTSYDHTGLSANDVRHYRVSAINTQGTGPASDAVRATARGDTTAPTVSSATVSTAGNRLTLVFSETMDQVFANEPALTAFRVTAGGVFVPLQEVGSTTGANRAINLARTIKDGQTVQVSYTDPTAGDDTKALQDTAGNDVASFADQSVTNNSTVAALVPEKPAFLTADPADPGGANQIDLAWGVPEYDGGSAVTSYKIEVSSDGGTTFTDLEASTGDTDTAYSHTGLPPDTTRHYRVTAINTVGTGAVSDDANATTVSGPGKPTGLTATGVTDKQIDLSWTAPAHVGDSAISGYRIEVSGSGTTWRNLVADTGDAATTYSHTGRRPNQTVYYRVSAINSQGTGFPSDVASATTPADTFPPTLTSSTVNAAGTQLGFNFNENVDPTTTNVPPLSAFAVTADGEAVPLHEIRVGGPRRYVMGIDRTVKMGQTVEVTYTDPTAGDDTEAMQDEAGNDVATFTVDPTNNSTVAPVAPDAPTGLTASAVGQSGIDLAWTAPAYSGGSAVTGYRIEVSDDAGATWTDRVANTGSAATAYSHTGLSAEDTRHYRVSAINSAGTGNASNVANATTLMADTAPDPPTNLSATAVGRTRIDLAWTAPSNNGGQAVTGYKIEVSSDGTSFTDRVANTGSTGTTYSHTGLAPNTTRHYRVSAINSVGTGNASSVANVTTDAASAPDPPTGLRARAAGRTRIDLSWSAPSDDGGAAVTGYRIEVSEDGSSWSRLEADTGSADTTWSHTGLAPGTTRHYRVSAINSVGAGNASSAANATTGRTTTTPRAPSRPSNRPPTVSASCDPCEVRPGGEVALTAAAADPDDDALTYAWSAAEGRFGDGTEAAAARWTAPGAPGRFTIRVEVSDGDGGSASAAVTVEVTNSPPAFESSEYAFELRENVDGSGQPADLGAVAAEDPDGDALTYALAAGDRERFAIGEQDGAVRYVGPGEDFEAEPNRYELTVRGSDAYGAAAEARMVVTIVNVNELPEAEDDEAATREDEAVTVDVLANDTDADGDPLQVESVSAPAHGTTAVAAGGVRYSPAVNYHGQDRFTYVVSDGNGGTAEAAVEVTVAPVNDAPAAVGTIPDQTLDEGGGEATVELGPFFEDIDGDALTYAARSSDPEVARVTVAGSVLMLAPVVYGSATVTVTAQDEGGLTGTQTFLVGVSDRLVRGAVSDTLAGMARSHLASARTTLGRLVTTGRRRQASRVTVLGRRVPLSKAAASRAAGRMLTQWLSPWTPHGAVGGAPGLGAGAGARFGAAAIGAGPGGVMPGGAMPGGAMPGGAGGLHGPAGAGYGGVSGGLSGGLGRFGGFRGGADPLRGSEFRLALGGSQDAEERSGPGRRWHVWGQGDVQTFQGAPSAATDYDGELLTAYVGADTWVSRQWLAGVAVARSRGEGDWRAAGSHGSLATTLTAVHPYVRWSDGTTAVWATAGGGWGEAENVRRNGRTGESGLGLRLGLVELQRRLSGSAGGVRFGVRADAAWAELRTAAGTESIDDQAVAVNQTRVGAEVTRPVRLGALALAPFGQAHARRDGGAGQTGTGLEVAGGVRLAAGMVRVDAEGRMLVLHSATGYQERGLAVRLGVGDQSREGLLLSVSPRWGEAAGRTGALWRDRIYQRARPEAGPDAWELDARGGYGQRLPNGRLLTWFGSLRQSLFGRSVEVGGRIGWGPEQLPTAAPPD